MSTSTQTSTRRPDAERATDVTRLRFGTTALVIGLLSQVPLGALHPHREYANDSVAAFHEYAHSGDWVLVHLGQFLGLLMVTIGLVAIALELARRRGAAGVLGLVAGITAVVSASVFAVQMAVDGVALKAAIDAWHAASGGTDQGAAYQVADAVRSVEKGLSALFNLLNGITVVTLGLGLTRGRAPGRRWGWLGAVAGLGFVTVGVLTALTGFSHAASTVALPATLAFAVFGVATMAATWRRAEAPARAVARPTSDVGAATGRR